MHGQNHIKYLEHVTPM